MSYTPGQAPRDTQLLAEFIQRELRRISDALKNPVQYRTMPVTASLSAGVSANWRVAAGNIVRISSSVTATLTGLAVLNPANREIVVVNVGTGVVVLKSQGTESSASFRFALASDWQLSANAAAVLWYDSYSSRWRGISRA